MTLRRLCLWLFVIGSVGLEAELLLLGHVEEFWQLVPVVLLPVGLAVTVVHLWRASIPSLRILQTVSAMFIVASVIGLAQHYLSNAEFELEMYPTRRGWLLFWESLRGAIPALAPGAMLQLGLLGLLSTFKYPMGVSPSKD